MTKPDSLLLQYLELFTEKTISGPILDLACGDGHNGIFLATQNLSVVCCDKSPDALGLVKRQADSLGLTIGIQCMDLEAKAQNPLEADFYDGILVFRYLHRPLIPCIKKAIREGGILIYETYTVHQRKYGKPHNPAFLLETGELREWFSDWEVLHYFDGVKENPTRAIAQIVCKKPVGDI